MTEIDIKIYMPLVPAFVLDNERTIGLMNNAIDELLELHNNINVKIHNHGEFELSIFKIEDYFKEPIKAAALLFQISIPNDFENLWEKHLENNTNYPVPKSVEQKQYILSLANNFFVEVHHLLILSQIAKPGSIKTREGEIFINGEFFKTSHSFGSSHRENIYIIEELKWATAKELSFLQVLSWFNQNQFSFYRHSTTKIERAINAFTYLFGQNKDEIFDLFWSLVGIEALYCSSKEGISEQIFEKTQIILGPLLDFKKRLKKMYDFRSRLVHGGLDIPPERYEIEDEKDIAFNKELINSSALAQAILTVTIQELILMNKCDLNFKYSLQN